jgi:aarF domain-containing kinase
MVMERLRGVPLTDLAVVSRTVTQSVSAETVLINALNVWGASVLGADTFHADLHAGEGVGRAQLFTACGQGWCSQ